MPDTFAITVAFIVLVTVIAAVAKRIRRDKCLKDFHGCLATLEDAAAKTVWGRLRVGTTGLEFVYQDVHKDADGHEETSYLVYKNEFGNIVILVRYQHELSDKERRQRDRDLARTYHPTFLRRLRRKTANMLKTIRDSIMDVINLLMAQVKKTTPAGMLLSSQDKYVSQMKQELLGTAGTSYEPLIEHYIGRKVVVDCLRGDKMIEYVGVLKEYTADFVELMDVGYAPLNSDRQQFADIVLPRRIAVVRHLAE